MSSVIENLDRAQTFDVWEKPPSRRRVVTQVFGDEDASLWRVVWLEDDLHRRDRDREMHLLHAPGWSDLDPTIRQLARQTLARQMLLGQRLEMQRRLTLARQMLQRLEVQRAANRNEHAIRIVERYRLQTYRPSLLRIGGLTGLAVIFASIPLLLASVSIGLIGMYAGFGLFSLANYAAYRAGEKNYILGPSVAAALAGASLLLAFIALVGALDGLS